MDVSINILNHELNPAAAINWVSDPQCGGINVFIGTVRNNTKGKEVLFLEFEAYEPMAISEMNKIAYEAKNKWNLQKVLIHHRIGKLSIGQIPVIIAVSSPHRNDAFTACQYIIDTLKKTVPIWKKEYFNGGEVWVAAHP